MEALESMRYPRSCWGAENVARITKLKQKNNGKKIMIPLPVQYINRYGLDCIHTSLHQGGPWSKRVWISCLHLCKYCIHMIMACFISTDRKQEISHCRPVIQPPVLFRNMRHLQVFPLWNLSIIIILNGMSICLDSFLLQVRNKRVAMSWTQCIEQRVQGQEYSLAITLNLNNHPGFFICIKVSRCILSFSASSKSV